MMWHEARNVPLDIKLSQSLSRTEWARVDWLSRQHLGLVRAWHEERERVRAEVAKDRLRKEIPGFVRQVLGDALLDNDPKTLELLDEFARSLR
jgi:hypothetical protein